jgi:cytoskeleton protein RodZ
MSDQEISLPEALEEEVKVARPLVQSPGAQLAATREAHGWTVEQVANQLNLAPRQIQAMESDNYAALPGLSIAKGFIRSYAKLLRIDATPLVAAVPGETANVTVGIVSSAALSSPFGDTRLPSMADRPVISAKWYVGLIVLVLAIAGLVWAQQDGLLQEATASWRAAIAAKVGENAAASATNAEPKSTPETDTGVKPATTEQAAEVPQQGDAVAETAAANAGAATAPAAPAANGSAAPAEVSPPVVVQNAKQDELVLKVTSDSWVEVRSDDNSIVFSGLINAGKTETFGLRGPASLVVGNAAGVEAVFRGAPLELKVSTTGNVARLSLK